MIIMNAGSSYFEHVENYYGSNACEQNSCRNAEMPAELKTEKAQRIKNNLIEKISCPQDCHHPKLPSLPTR